jgi:TPR repeat protein
LRLAARLRKHGRERPAFDVYAKAARTGSAEAAYQVGRGYLEGKVVPISRISAAHWLEQAAR